MLSLLAESLWTAPASQFFPYGFLLVAGALACMVALEMQRAARDSANKKDSTEFMAHYREDNRTPMFFAEDEELSELTVHPVLATKSGTGI